MQREIEQNPTVPKLGPAAIELLTKLCFRPDDNVEPVDLLFGFSSPTGIEAFAETIKNLLVQGVSKKVFISGGIPKYDGTAQIPRAESETVLELINPALFPEVEFFSETKSTNTLQNVTEALQVLDFSNYEKVMFVFKKHDSRRAYLTLRKFLSHTTLLQQTFTPTYPGTDIPLDSNSWHTFDFGISRVWGEYLRIKQYGQRGDIAYDDETKNLVNQIDALTSDMHESA